MPSKNNFLISKKNTVWFIKNTTTEGPGYFAPLLQRWKIPFQICDLQKGDKLPAPRKKDAVIVLGGPMSANDQTPSMLMLLKWIRLQLKRKTPYLGICLGLQTLVKSAGGKVVKSPVKEIGLKHRQRPYVCLLTRKGEKDTLFTGFKKSFSIFHLHSETVVLKPSMDLIAEGEECLNQIVKVTSQAYGIQGHLEMTTKLLSEWLETDDDLRREDSKKMLREWQRVKKELNGNCRKILLNFLKMAGIIR